MEVQPHVKNVSAEKAPAQQGAWLPQGNGNRKRQKGSRSSPFPRPQASEPLIEEIPFLRGHVGSTVPKTIDTNSMDRKAVHFCYTGKYPFSITQRRNYNSDGSSAGNKKHDLSAPAEKGCAGEGRLCRTVSRRAGISCGNRVHVPQYGTIEKEVGR